MNAKNVFIYLGNIALKANIPKNIAVHPLNKPVEKPEFEKRYSELRLKQEARELLGR